MVQKDYKAKFAHKHSLSNSCYFCIDKIGRPVRIDQLSSWQVEKIIKEIPMEDTVALFSLEEEMLVHCILPMCSKIAGKRIEQDVIIQDMKGFGVGKLMDKPVREWFKALAKVAQDNYPELLGQTIIINAPFYINAAWAVISKFLDKRTRKKITILGSNYQKKLYEIVDRDV